MDPSFAPAPFAPNESNAPALTRLSNTRLFTRRRSSWSHKLWSDVIRPCDARTPRIDAMAPSPTFFTAVRPKRTPSGVTVKAN